MNSILKFSFILVLTLLSYSVTAQRSIPKQLKKEFKIYFKEFSEAFYRRDSLWIENHSNSDVYTMFIQDTETFSNQNNIDVWVKKLSFKPSSYRPTTNETYIVSLGKITDTIGAIGGTFELVKKKQTWIIIKYNYPK